MVDIVHERFFFLVVGRTGVVRVKNDGRKMKILLLMQTYM